MFLLFQSEYSVERDAEMEVEAEGRRGSKRKLRVRKKSHLLAITPDPNLRASRA